MNKLLEYFKKCAVLVWDGGELMAVFAVATILMWFYTAAVELPKAALTWLMTQSLYGAEISFAWAELVTFLFLAISILGFVISWVRFGLFAPISGLIMVTALIISAGLALYAVIGGFFWHQFTIVVVILHPIIGILSMVVFFNMADAEYSIWRQIAGFRKNYAI